jgi:dihydrodipicolinate synthase/N-acetylneuraminate lyase
MKTVELTTDEHKVVMEIIRDILNRVQQHGGYVHGVFSYTTEEKTALIEAYKKLK